MKVFQDFHLRGNEANLLRFRGAIESFLSSSDWSQIIDDKLSDKHIIIEYNGDALSKSRIYLYMESATEFSVGNILPLKKNSLTYDEYNEILNKCVQDIFIPCATECDLAYEVSTPEISINDTASAETVKKLRRFSVAANKSTGSSHPLDNERWNDFICESFRQNETEVGHYLRRWLVEEEGWSDEMASELVIEYENGISLLTHFKEKYL